jgi:drug/metabolite transporter (DMT)-like permease
MTVQNTRLGIWLMVLTTFIFAAQDGISRHLAGEYNVFMVVMIRYWFFAAFVITIATRKAGGLRSAAATSQPLMQGFRALLLVAEICVMIYGFTLLGLVESHAVFAAYPLLIAALSGPVLGERVGWRRWVAIAVGFVGVTIILEPGFGVFQPAAVVPFIAALMFALYGLLTRFVARRDSAATSFFWTGTVGSVAMTAVGAWFWEPMTGPDWVWMGALHADQMLRGGRGERGAALRLSATGLRQHPRYPGLFRDHPPQRGSRHGADRGGGALHPLAATPKGLGRRTRRLDENRIAG